MDNIRSKELESKQLADLITAMYQEMQGENGVLVAPDGDSGIFKYAGASPQAQYYLSRMSKKRDVQRSGLGFVIQRAEFPDHFRLSLDVEISEEVTGKDAKSLVETMNAYVQSEYGTQAPALILYLLPAHSGKRGWADKTFVGIEVEVKERDFKALNRMKKRIVDAAKKLFYALDYALTAD